MLAAQEVAPISKLSFFYLLLQGPRQWDFKWLNFVDATVENGPWIVTCVFFYEHGLILIPAYISNHMPSKVWDEITYPFLNFKSHTIEV